MAAPPGKQVARAADDARPEQRRHNHRPVVETEQRPALRQRPEELRRHTAGEVDLRARQQQVGHPDREHRGRNSERHYGKRHISSYRVTIILRTVDRSSIGRGAGPE